MSESNLKFVQDNYVNIVHCLEKFKPQVHTLLTIQLLFDVPKLVALLFGCVLLVKVKTPTLIFFNQISYISQLVIQLVLPALMVEKTISQITCLKRLLHDELLKEHDNMTCPACEIEVEREAAGLLRYLEARPLDDKLWSVVPTDLRLLVILFSLCTTYFIVLVQITRVTE